MSAVQTKEIIAYILPTGGQAGAHNPAARAAATAGAATNARGAASWVAKAAFYIQPKSGKFSFCRKHWETLALLWHLGVWTLRVSGKEIVSHHLKSNAALASCMSWAAVPGTCCSDVAVASQTWTTEAANRGLKVLGNVISRLISAGKLEETSAGVKKKNTNCKNLSWPR